MPFPRFAVTGPVPCDALVLTHPRMCSAPSIAQASQATIPVSPNLKVFRGAKHNSSRRLF